MVIRPVKGSGPIPARILLIGERPGKVENARGKPFVGPSGQELDRYLLVNAGIDRADCYVTNLVKTYSEKPPSPEEIDRDWSELRQEICKVQPQYVGFVGLYAARAFLGDDIDIEWSHGLYFPSTGVKERFDYPMVIIDSTITTSMMVLTHPAAGLHQSATAAKIAWDFGQFGRMCRGEKMPNYHLHDCIASAYGEVTDLTDMEIDETVAIDTEGTIERPWCLSYSHSAGAAFVKRQGYLGRYSSTVILHNALHDLLVLDAMGVTIGRFEDTMIKAFHLGVEPQGLKALCRRHCGMHMQSYDDLMAEARREKALEYLSKVIDYAEANTAKAG